MFTSYFIQNVLIVMYDYVGIFLQTDNKLAINLFLH